LVVVFFYKDIMTPLLVGTSSLEIKIWYMIKHYGGVWSMYSTSL